MSQRRSIQIVKRRSGYAALSLINRGGSVGAAKPMTIPGKGRAANRTFRKSVANLLRQRRKAGEYHRGL